MRGKQELVIVKGFPFKVLREHYKKFPSNCYCHGINHYVKGEHKAVTNNSRRRWLKYYRRDWLFINLKSYHCMYQHDPESVYFQEVKEEIEEKRKED